MASIRKDIQIESPAPDVWAAVADAGAIHERLARDFVTDTRLEGDRIAYAVVDSPLGLSRHHASMQVVPEGEHRSRLVWIADVAPDEAALMVGELMEQGALAMRHTLEGVSR